MLAREALCGTRRIGWEMRGPHTLGSLESMFGMWSTGEKGRRWSEPLELLAQSEISRCRWSFPNSILESSGLCMNEKILKLSLVFGEVEIWREKKKSELKPRKEIMKILLRGALISSLLFIFSLPLSVWFKQYCVSHNLKLGPKKKKKAFLTFNNSLFLVFTLCETFVSKINEIYKAGFKNNSPWPWAMSNL